MSAFAEQVENPRLEVVPGGWGGAESNEIHKIIAGVVKQFPAPIAYGSRPSLQIRHRFGGPMIDYDRDTDGSIIIYLSARDDRWYQYVYQFAHEYCHVLARFNQKQRGGDIVRDNQWFEESLCETASLYAVHRLGVDWSADADAQLRAAAIQLAQYLKQLAAEPQRQLDPGANFVDWFASNQESLRRDPYHRELNELVAMQLLPFFERNPDLWQALAYLNAPTPIPGQPFTAFLSTWEAASPIAARPLIAQIRSLFGQ
ncbi:hypothetical protein GALL_118750 [mine drainage metagenome]|uniref:Uncharacterized protein n=1 Tax=mine drainage metagenome TaxID=410659 RepID=A0A1J5T1K2_9ZZZZ